MSKAMHILSLTVMAGVLSSTAALAKAAESNFALTFIDSREPLSGALAATFGFLLGSRYGDNPDRWALTRGQRVAVAFLTAGSGAPMHPVLAFPVGVASGAFFGASSDPRRFR